MPKRYKQPDEFLVEGGWIGDEYADKNISLVPLITDMSDNAEQHYKWSVDLAVGGSYVILKGPVKVLVQSTDVSSKPRMHTSEVVTVPFGEEVRFENYQEAKLGRDINMGLVALSAYSPVKTSAMAGVPSGIGGAVGGQYFMENPFVGVVTAVVGAVGGYAWERSQYSEYSVERKKY